MQPIHPANQLLYDRAATKLDLLEQMPVGVALYAELIALQAASMDAAGAVRVTALWLKLVAHCEAQSMIPTVDALTSSDILAEGYGLDAPQLIAHEMAAISSTPYSTSLARVELAHQASEQLPASWVALDRGEISLAHLKALARVVRVATPRVAAAVEDRVLPPAVARGWTPTQLTRAAVKVLMALDPEAARDRAAAAKADADVRFYPGLDDTASIVANGGAEQVRRLADAIEVRAAELGRDGDLRPIGQRRMDALADLVFGPDAARRPVVETVVTIDLTTLLGLTQQPGELSGYGPITAEYARELSKFAWLRRLVTDPFDGRMLDLGRKRYRPSAALRRLIEARDRTCRHVGCSRPAATCQIDHRVAWPIGGTDEDNLHSMCPMHHDIKTRKAWQVDIEPDGTEVFISALGFRYRRPPATYPIELVEPLEEIEPTQPRDVLPEHDPDPPGCDDPLPESPPLTEDEQAEVLDALNNGFGSYAARVYDTLRRADLVA